MADELLGLLQNVPDVYEDFIAAVKCIVNENPNMASALIRYITDNPEAKTDDILEFATD